MYVPSHFEEADREKLHRLIDEHPFADLVTCPGGEAPFATPLPFMLDASRGENGTLLAHMARANPQWRHFASGREALVIFRGPHAYISPSWYVGGENVPTWNYVAVHAYGVPRVLDDDAAVERMLSDLVARNEARFEKPWTLEGQSREFLAELRHAIVAFEIPVARLEGKLKLGQNRASLDREGAACVLSTSEDPAVRKLAKLMLNP